MQGFFSLTDTNLVVECSVHNVLDVFVPNPVEKPKNNEIKNI